MPKPFLPLSPAQFRDLLNPRPDRGKLTLRDRFVRDQIPGRRRIAGDDVRIGSHLEGAKRACLELCEGARFSTRASRCPLEAARGALVHADYEPVTAA